ncbi:MAG: ZIP family metal transporter [Limnobacter sp.]|nr:ZIP family metal transporter [Limnobacter sp.]
MLQIFAACLLGGLLSMLAASLVLFGLSKKWLPYAVSFSTGALLATSMLHLIPEALASGLTPDEAFPFLLAGVLGFFALEKFAIWRHAHQHGKGCIGDAHTIGHVHRDAGPLGILIGDGFHNFTDGLLIAAAFLTDPAVGWATTLAVIAHEIPQEAGDFAILLAAGWHRARALYWNAVSSLASVLGGLMGYFALEQAQHWVPYTIMIAAASFLYIAIADLLPRLRGEWHGIAWHGVLLAAGIAVSVL